MDNSTKKTINNTSQKPNLPTDKIPIYSTVPPFMSQQKQLNLKAEQIKLAIPCLKDKYVVKIDNAFSKEECSELINYSENIGYTSALVNLGFGYKEEMNEFRNHSKLSIDNTTIADYILNRIKSIIPSEFNGRKLININERLRFLRYSSNEYFGPHYDGMYVRQHGGSGNGQRSLITILIYLNDNYTGGEFQFLHPTNKNKYHSIAPVCGSILLFEQNQVYHQGSMVLNGCKYCIRSDIMYSNEIISPQNVPKNIGNISYEVEKQTVYFQRNNLKKKYTKPVSVTVVNVYSDECLTNKIVHFWLITAFKGSYNKLQFPMAIYSEIAAYCQIFCVLDFIGDVTELLWLARIAETAERYDDMSSIMVNITKIKCNAWKRYGNKSVSILTKEERNLLSVAYKNCVGANRASWRTLSGELSSITDPNPKTDDNITPNKDDKKDDLIPDVKKIFLCKKYLNIVENEVIKYCLQVIDVVENNLIMLLDKYSLNKNKEEITFFNKMCGDYYRYLCEIKPKSNEYIMKSEHYYQKAIDMADKHFKPTHPIVLGLKLNCAVYYYELAKKTDKACKMAKFAFDSAINQLDTLNDENYKDSTLIMRLLRDNLTLWTSEPDP